MQLSADGRATGLRLFNFSTPQMRAFHLSWFSFFLCFFAWFGVAPLMPVVRDELGLTKEQIGWSIIASVSATIFARLLVGWLCDRVGPRLTYTWLLILASLPVMAIGLAHDFETFLLFRLLIGCIGASFVITQYHTSIMFAPNCVGTANATSAGWGNLGGGVTQLVMPLLFTLLATGLGLGAYWGWRLAMFFAGLVCLLTGVAYYRLTQDGPRGNFAALRAAGKMPAAQRSGSFWQACRDYRVWLLFLVYGACFGVELTIDNIAALYFVDYFDLSLTAAGMAAAVFGGMNIFARSLGGIVADRCGLKFGPQGRVAWLFCVLFCEGVMLMVFSQVGSVALAIPALLAFGLFVKMSNGATYAVVPFVNPQALGSVAGIVGAGGNAGAVAAGFLFKSSLDWPSALLILGFVVTLVSFAATLVRLEPRSQTTESMAGLRPAVAIEG